jgi:hypothetical protein
MSRKKTWLLFLPALLATVVPWQTLAQDDPNVIVTTHHINPVRDARTPWDEVANCLRDAACAAIVNTFAGELGVSPQAIGMVKVGVAFSAQQNGEETRYAIAPVKSYKICRVEIRTASVVPATGDCASLFSITATPDAVNIYTWTPKQGIGEGRSWYDGVVAVAHAQETGFAALQSQGKCTVSPKDSQYQCRGASGVNHGLAACGSKAL